MLIDSDDYDEDSEEEEEKADIVITPEGTVKVSMSRKTSLAKQPRKSVVEETGVTTIAGPRRGSLASARRASIKR